MQARVFPGRQGSQIQTASRLKHQNPNMLLINCAHPIQKAGSGNGSFFDTNPLRQLALKVPPQGGAMAEISFNQLIIDIKNCTMRRLILLAFFLPAGFFFARAQGTISEKLEPKVADLIKLYTDTNKAAKFVKGWRIQLLATTDRDRAETSLQQLQSRYPNIAADWIHAKPYYKLRAGAFTSKRDALQMLYLLKLDYPTAYPVQDNEIKPVELLGR